MKITGRNLLLITSIVLVLGIPASIVAQKILGSGQPLTPKDIAKQVDMSCPIKGNYSVHLVKVGGMVLDKDVTTSGGDGRYCQWSDDLLYCSKNNPTPNIPCKQINLLQSGHGDLTFHDFIHQDHDVSLGAWGFISKNSSIYLTVYTVDRAYKMDSCRYWNQWSGITMLENVGLFSVDKKTSGQMALCVLDQAAENEYQASLKPAKQYVGAIMDINRGVWQKSCAKDDFGCSVTVAAMYKKALADANTTLEYTYDGDAKGTMVYISKKYEPLMAEAIKKYNQQPAKAAKDYVSAMMEIKRGAWQQSCPKNNLGCTMTVNDMVIKASAEANKLLEFNNNDAKNTIVFISKKYEPLVAAAIKKVLGK